MGLIEEPAAAIIKGYELSTLGMVKVSTTY
jgi:hypothetical protein